MTSQRTVRLLQNIENGSTSQLAWHYDPVMTHQLGDFGPEIACATGSHAHASTGEGIKYIDSLLLEDLREYSMPQEKQDYWKSVYEKVNKNSDLPKDGYCYCDWDRKAYSRSYFQLAHGGFGSNDWWNFDHGNFDIGDWWSYGPYTKNNWLGKDGNMYERKYDNSWNNIGNGTDWWNSGPHTTGEQCLSTRGM